MSLREGLAKKPPAVGISIGVVLVLIAAVVLSRTFWPERKADLSRAFYTDDDGQSWFLDSATRITPFDHNGREAVVAHVYSYAEGKKQFCSYLAKFTPEAKAQLSRATEEAVRAGKPAESVGLYRDPAFTRRGVLVKAAGAAGQWIPYGDPKALPIFSIHAPDGSTVDEVFAQ